MRAKCVALIIVSLVFCAASSAQEYSISANRGLNLRVAPSLNAEIADTVRAGSILQVVGKLNRWLKIHRNGRDVWLADWVDYSRIESAAPTGPQQPTAPIDNCCFVDRQCQSEQEWSEGYWAYQNGQCAAPAQPQPAAPAQPVASAPAIVDNCCFVDRQCQNEGEWEAGYYAFLYGQCATSAQPQPAAPAQPAVTVPANVNNCCFVDRQCQNEEEWEAGYYAFLYGQCAQAQPVTAVLPSASELAAGGNCCSLGWHCRFEEERVQGYWVYQINQCAGLPQIAAVTLTGPVPRIEGSSQFVQHIISSLKWVKSLAPDWYNYVVTGMDLIYEVPVHVSFEDGMHTCTMRAYSRERKVSVETCWMFWTLNGEAAAEIDQVSTAAVLAHEACHIHTYEEGKHFASQEDEEKLCTKFNLALESLLGSELTTRLNPRQGTNYLPVHEALSLVRQYCSEGYRADLFCPLVPRVENIWRNVPYAVFPPEPSLSSEL